MKLKNLEKERSKRGWTQEEIATKLGVARTTYVNWENGKREVDLETVEKIADLFEVSVDYLMGRVTFESQKDLGSFVKEPEVQFIMRAKQELSPKAFEKFMELAKKTKEMFEDEEGD